MASLTPLPSSSHAAMTAPHTPSSTSSTSGQPPPYEIWKKSIKQNTKIKLPTFKEEKILKKAYFFKMNCPLFKELSDENAIFLAKHSHKRKYKEKEVICSQGEEAKKVFILKEGFFGINIKQPETGEAAIISCGTKGTVFGEMARYNNNRRIATCLANKSGIPKTGDKCKTVVYECSTENFYTVLDQTPSAKIGMFITQNDKLRKLNNEYLRLQAGKIEHKKTILQTTQQKFTQPVSPFVISDEDGTKKVDLEKVAQALIDYTPAEWCEILRQLADSLDAAGNHRLLIDRLLQQHLYQQKEQRPQLEIHDGIKLLYAASMSPSLQTFFPLFESLCKRLLDGTETDQCRELYEQAHINRSLWDKVLPGNAIERSARNQEFSDLVHILSHLPEFASLKFPELCQVALMTEQLRLKDDETVFNQGDEGDAIYFIIDGSIRIVQDGRELARLNEGEHFGEMALRPGEKRSGSAIANGNGASVLKIGRAQLLHLFEKHPKIADAFIDSKVRRIALCNEKIAEARKIRTEGSSTKHSDNESLYFDNDSEMVSTAAPLSDRTSTASHSEADEEDDTTVTDTGSNSSANLLEKAYQPLTMRSASDGSIQSVNVEQTSLGSLRASSQKTLVSGANQLEQRIEEKTHKHTVTAEPSDKENVNKYLFSPLLSGKDKNEEIQNAYKNLLDAIENDPFLQKVKTLHSKYNFEMCWKGNKKQKGKLKTLSFQKISRAFVCGDDIIPRSIKINDEMFYRHDDPSRTTDRIIFLKDLLQSLNRAGFSSAKTDEQALKSAEDFFDRIKDDICCENYLKENPIECIPILRAWSINGYWHGYGMMREKLPELFNADTKNKITYLNAINGSCYSVKIEDDLEFSASTRKVYGVFPTKQAKGNIDTIEGFFHVTWTVDKHWNGRRIIYPYLGSNDETNDQILENLGPIKKGIFN